MDSKNKCERELKKLTNKVKLYPKGINIPTPDIRGKIIKIKSQFVNSQSLTSPLFRLVKGIHMVYSEVWLQMSLEHLLKVQQCK
jgi:hypothetical protein